MPVSQEAAALAGAKRKRVAATKFYAVRVGHQPGIYHNWNECFRQVKGFKGATFKSFLTLTDAERFIAGENRPGSAANQPYKFYAVRRGRVPGIYTDWSAAQGHIKGWVKPVYRCFSTRAEAQRFLDEGDANAATNEELEADVHQDFSSYFSNEIDEPPTKKARASAGAANSAQNGSRLISEDAELDYEPGLGLPLGVEDGFDTNIILEAQTGNVVFKTRGQREATKLRTTGQSAEHPLRIYTDGSSLKNGQVGAVAGVGVYFGPADSRNLSESLPGPRQTNQRAELTAIIRALDTAPKDRDICIVTDSEYSINCSTKWHTGWRKNGWKTAAGKSVENRDLVENIVGKIEERTALHSRTLFEWIKGHANHAGNAEADRLAVGGARRAAQLPAVE